jgi:hypothetical protein
MGALLFMPLNPTFIKSPPAKPPIIGIKVSNCASAECTKSNNTTPRLLICICKKQKILKYIVIQMRYNTSSLYIGLMKIAIHVSAIFVYLVKMQFI